VGAKGKKMGAKKPFLGAKQNTREEKIFLDR
jgi:hypothetical protein